MEMTHNNSYPMRTKPVLTPTKGEQAGGTEFLLAHTQTSTALDAALGKDDTPEAEQDFLEGLPHERNTLYWQDCIFQWSGYLGSGRHWA